MNRKGTILQEEDSQEPRKGVGKGYAVVYRHAFHYSVGTVGSKVITMLLFPLLASRLGFSATGIYDLVISSVAFIIPVLCLNIPNAVYRWLKEEDKTTAKEGFSNALALCLVAGIIILLIAFIVLLFHPVRFGWLATGIALTGIWLAFFQEALRGIGKVKVYSVVNIINNITFYSFALFALFPGTDKLSGVLTAVLLANVVSILVCLSQFPLADYFDHGLLSAQNRLSLLRYAVPLIINAMSWNLLLLLNKYLVFHYLGTEANGIFAVVHKTGMGVFFAGMLLYQAVQDHWISDSRLRYKEKEFWSMLKRVLLIGVLAWVMLLCGAWLYFGKLLPGLRGVILYLPLFGLAILFNVFSNYSGILYNYEKRSFSMAFTTISGALVSICLSFAFVRPWGLWGVFTGITLGAMAVMIMRLLNARKFFKQAGL